MRGYSKWGGTPPPITITLDNKVTPSKNFFFVFIIGMN